MCHRFTQSRDGIRQRVLWLAYQPRVAGTERPPTLEVSQASIRIENAPAGHCGFVGEAHAKRWIKQGRARFTTGGLLELSEHQRILMTRMKYPGQAVDGLGYDRIYRMMRAHEKRAIPLAERG